MTPAQKAKYQAANREFRRTVEEVDFKGDIEHTQTSATQSDTHGTIGMKFKLRDPDAKPAASPAK